MNPLPKRLLPRPDAGRFALAGLLAGLLAGVGFADAGAALSPSAPSARSAQAERDRWWQRLHWSESLCPRGPIAEDDPGVESYPLPGGRKLVEVRCFLGAYQGQSILYLLAQDRAHGPLVLKQLESPDEGALEPYLSPEIVGLIEVAPATGELRVLRRYRGIGDCGQLLTYRLKESDAELTALRARDCDESGKPVPPERWPRVPVPQ